MDAAESLETLKEKYKNNGYRLSKSDSKTARQLIIELLKEEKMQKISDAIDYVIEFPAAIGIRAYVDYYQNLDENRQRILNKMLVNNESFKENTNQRTIKRVSVLLDKMIANGIEQNQIYFILKNVCRLILNGRDEPEAKMEEKQKLLSIFSANEEVASLKFSLAKEQRVKNNLKSELAEAEEKVAELKKEVEELKEKKQKNSRMFGFW